MPGTKKILIIVTGSIAAVKIPELVSSLRKKDYQVTCLLTDAAGNFVTPMALAYLSENKIYTDMFEPDGEYGMSHINLSRENDLILVAPASADFIAKLANGLCDDLASTVCLAADKQIVVAPAMNPQMLDKPATKRNLKTIKEDGILIIEPEKGKMACGEEGYGRMAEVESIIKFVEKNIGKSSKSPKKEQRLKGKRCLVTSGPTRESIDPVRYISNYSSGKQGYAIAASLAEEGAEVILVSGPTNLEAPDGVEQIKVASANEMLEKCRNNLPFDVVVCAAAVADWKPETYHENKIKKKHDEPNSSQMLTLIENPDILSELSKSGKNRAKLVIGFAAESEHLIENAMVKLERKGCDWIVANNIAENEVFDSDDNSVHIIDSTGVIKSIENQPKKVIAEQLVEMSIKQLRKK